MGAAPAPARRLVLLRVVVGVPLAEDAVERVLAGLGRPLAAALVVELPVAAEAAAHEVAVHVEAVHALGVLLHGSAASRILDLRC